MTATRELTKDEWDAHPSNPLNHEGFEEPLLMWQYRRYMDAVRTFMEMRAKMGESPCTTLGVVEGTWPHHFLKRLIDAADDPELCKRETKRLEETIERMGDPHG